MEFKIKGLTQEKVEQQIKLGYVNVVPDKAMKTKEEIIKGNVFTYFNGIFLVLTILLIISGSFRSLTFLPVVIANTLIGIFQQLKAKKVLDDLTVLSISECTAIRDGNRVQVPVNKLVLNDVVVLESGMQIPADAEVLSGKIMVNEALLTGESDEIEKVVNDELKSGSFVVSGRCIARLTHVGKESYVARLTEKAKKIVDKQSEMIHGIDIIVKMAGFAIIPIGLGLFLQGLLVNELTFAQSVVSMVGAVIGMVPEGLYLLVTVTLALSAARLAQKKVLLHDMKSTETLARVDVLCVDKTGTITNNEMNVTEVFEPMDPLYDYDWSTEILSSYINTITDTNMTMMALRKFFSENTPMEVIDMMPFSSKEKYSQIETPDGIYRLGAPEFLLSPVDLEDNEEEISLRTQRGERVLALVHDKKSGGIDFVPLLFVSLENGLRENVEETIDYLESQGVEVMVISGDNPSTVSRIASLVHIPNADKYVDVSSMSAEQINEAVKSYKIFGRVRPEQKKDIVLALKKDGKKVAMTGDGVNDILAMKEADCSIAMGAGSDAAMQAAQVVLLDSDFSHMQEIIGEGRRDINNITRSATLFLYKNMFSMLLALFSIWNAFSYPLQPSQVSLVSAFNIGIPAFLLALEPNEKKQNHRFLRVVLLRALPAGLTSFLSIAAMVVFGQMFDIPASDIGVTSTFLLSVVGFLILNRLCYPMNGYRRFVFVGCLIGEILCAYFFSELFEISYISSACLMLCAVFAFADESLMRNLTMMVDRWLHREPKKQEES